MQPTNIFVGFLQIFFIFIFSRFLNNFIEIISLDFPEILDVNFNDIIYSGVILLFQ